MIQFHDAATDRFLNDLDLLSARMTKAQDQLSSGKRIQSASDGPDSVSPLLQVRANLARLEQNKSDLGRVKTEVDAGEASLQSAVTLFDQVRTLGMQGASGMQDATTRTSLADQIGSIMERLVGLANSEVDGRYIFSGDSDQKAPYSIDFANTPPWSTYQGSAATREAIHPTGITFPISLSAQTIFDNPDPTKNVFQSIEALRQALLANDDAALKTALEPLAGISTFLNSSLTFYGNVQNQLTEAADTNSKLTLRLETERTTLEDADSTTAIVEMQQYKYQQQAAFQVRGAMPTSTLFSYLK